LKTLIAKERETGEKVDADVITWRGMMTKVRYINWDEFLGSIADNDIAHGNTIQ
jgi:RAT1-interacting protein